MNYNIKQQRSPKAAKRSYTKYSIEKLESLLPNLTESQQEYLRLIIDAIQTGDDPKLLLSNYIAKLTGAKKELIQQIEATFKEREELIYGKVIHWFKNDKNFNHLNEEQIIKEAKNYIEMQKWNLFRSIHNYLGKLDIVKTKNTRFQNTQNGFEGDWTLTLQDGTTKFFETKSIIAEGLIQRAHYRYLINLK